MSALINSANETFILSAIRNNSFVPWFQPRVSIDGDKIVGCEALARVETVAGVIPPAFFIQEAINFGLISYIDLIIAKKAIECLKYWFMCGLVDLNFTLSFNIDRSTLLSKIRITQLIEIINQSNNLTSMIEVEVTENSIEDESHRAIVLENLNFLKQETKIKIALDDFTVGHSSATNLILFPIDTVKIDKVFAHLSKRSKTIRVLKLMCDFNRECGYRTVMEGIETVEQHTKMKSLPIDEFQGFLFSKPLPENLFISTIKDMITPHS
jgi:EAL domain-containing protein (putative c-di-GMP-specific phosphodiesterase class I)